MRLGTAPTRFSYKGWLATRVGRQRQCASIFSRQPGQAIGLAPPAYGEGGKPEVRRRTRRRGLSGGIGAGRGSGYDRMPRRHPERQPGDHAAHDPGGNDLSCRRNVVPRIVIHGDLHLVGVGLVHATALVLADLPGAELPGADLPGREAGESAREILCNSGRSLVA